MFPSLSCGASAGRRKPARTATKRMLRRTLLGGAGLAVVLFGLLAAPPARAGDSGCDGVLEQKGLPITLDARVPEDAQPNLLVKGACVVKPGKYYFGEVNIIKGGKLTFEEGPKSMAPGTNAITFWAKSILIENGGAMTAGVDGAQAFGTDGGKLDIVLYGPDQTKGNRNAQGKGALCVSPPYVRGYQSTPAGDPVPDCGIPTGVWGTDNSVPISLVNDAPGGDKPANVVKDYFYKYGSMMFDGGLTDGRVGHFGYKVLGLSYGGILELRGYKGATGGNTTDPTSSGTSWVRLAADAPAGATELTLSRSVQGDWKSGDRIVVTTTDYVPDHSEERTIGTVTGNKITLVSDDPKKPGVPAPLKYSHNGQMFDVGNLLGVEGKAMTKGMDPALQGHAETRAAVALLSRSIVIESGGDRAGETFAEATDGDTAKGIPKDSHYAMGATTVFRQGFMKLHIDGVEFRNMGVGGRMGHYPVHFHEARIVPHFPNNQTYVRDSSVNDSMTRWFVLHDTDYAELSSNVGWKSIGHGYYLEDGTEANNKLYANIGILARAGVYGADNPRDIPGILAGLTPADQTAYNSDVLHPSVFWITNGWNELIGNMAAGTGTCGSCFWYVPAWNSDRMDVGPDGKMSMAHQEWTGYSAEQGPAPTYPGGGTTPVKFFFKNYCSTAMQAVNFVEAGSSCNAVAPIGTPNTNPDDPRIIPIVNPLAAPPPPPPPPPPAVPPPVDPVAAMYYPHLEGERRATICTASTNPNDPTPICKGTDRCDGSDPKTCAVSVVDHFTTSFNWAETNFAAIWMRGSWNMVDNSFISDVQNGGVTLVSGGDYSRASAPLGYWSLLSHSVLAGYTQPQDDANKYAREEGPCTALKCSQARGDTRIVKASSIGYPLSLWATYQRMFSIYDGPAAEDANAYLNIKAVDCNDRDTCMYFGVQGVRRYPGTDKGYLPNAAIGWKQPNGFYYPPAFGSRDLFFKNVDIRHFVVTPIQIASTYLTDPGMAKKQLIGLVDQPPSNLYSGYTDIDRETVLNDEDGSLTGFAHTISVNDDPSVIENDLVSKPVDGFFGGPVQASECESSVGVNPRNACAGQVPKTPPSTRTSPYDYVTTVIYPACATTNNNGGVLNPAACGSAVGNDAEAKDGPGASRFTKNDGRGGEWSKECAGPYCNGVKLYRQDLAVGSATYKREWERWTDNECGKKDTPASAYRLEYDKTTNTMTPGKCDFPFIRMAGMNEWQRSSLTANGAIYYIDTTTSKQTQEETPALGTPGDQFQNYVECKYRTNPPENTRPCEQRSVNVFQPKQTYYVLFLFVKPTTKQTYQIYVGSDFNLTNDLSGIRVTDASLAFKTEPWALPQAWRDSAKMISSVPDGPEDVLQITVDFSALNGTPQLNPKKLPADQICMPKSFCTGDGASCHCALSTDKEPWLALDPTILNSCNDACSNWATNDLDYPASGILGFAFTLPGDFKAKDQYERPQPEQAPLYTGEKDPDGKDTPTPWNVPFKPASAALAGTCFHQPGQIPGQGSCGVPN